LAVLGQSLDVLAPALHEQHVAEAKRKGADLREQGHAMTINGEDCQLITLTEFQTLQRAPRKVRAPEHGRFKQLNVFAFQDAVAQLEVGPDLDARFGLDPQDVFDAPLHEQ
jgi:nucleoid DNA-binding protein